jgi:hypothetical protein
LPAKSRFGEQALGGSGDFCRRRIGSEGKAGAKLGNPAGLMRAIRFKNLP